MSDLQTCKIRLDYPGGIRFLDQTFRALETLTALENVTLVTDVTWTVEAIASMGVFVKGPPPDLDRDMYLDMHC